MLFLSLNETDASHLFFSGFDVASKFVNKEEEDIKKNPTKLKASIGEMLRRSPDELTRLDGMMKREMHEVTSSIIKECLPGGQLKVICIL